MEIGELYFWTSTIKGWKHLLKAREFKEIILSSLQYLSELRKVDVFGFVIMPNHIHLIWKILEHNGKELPQGSFLKYTAHQFLKTLRNRDASALREYEVDKSEKSHEFWLRDPLAIHLYNRKIAYQKLDYIHRNPLAGHWQLAKDPCDYEFSSAAFYEENVCNFSFLKDLREEF